MYGCALDAKGPSFIFVVENDCLYTVSVSYQFIDSEENYEIIPPGSIFTMAGSSHTRETQEKAEKRFFSSSKHKVHILYPDGYKETMEIKDFAAQADAQSGKEGKGFWTLTLCPDNENPPPPGEAIRRPPHSASN